MQIFLVRRAYSASGGAEKYLLRLAKALLERDHTVSLLSDCSWPEQVLPAGLRLEILPAKTPRQFADALQSWQQQQTDSRQASKLLSLERLHHADFYRAGDGVHAAWLERRRAFEPSWKHLSRRFNGKHAQLLALEASLANSPQTQLICNSQLVAREWQQHYGVAPERIQLIPNGFDPDPALLEANREQLRQELAQELQLDPEASWGLFVGSGFQRKGLPQLLQAFQQLHQQKAHQSNSPTLLIAGKGKLSASQKANLPPHTKLLGARRDIPRLLRACDWFCLPTWYDPFSNATLEAAAYGLPVITTSANGFHEQMQDGIHGSVIEAGDLQALSAALSHWSAREVSEAARAACQENAQRLSMEANVQATLECLGV